MRCNGSSPGKLSRHHRAFTLTEVLVSVGVLGVTIVSLFTGFSQSFNVVQVNRENLRATQILQEKMEMIRLYSWAQVTNNYVPTNFTENFDPTGATNHQSITYTGTVTLTNVPISETYSNDMRLITINLTWVSENVTHTRNMSSYIAKYGLQNYIY